MAEMRQSTARGFTLLEVLVALAIFAVAAMALLNAGRDQIQGSGHLEDRTFAHWVALNWIAELQTANSLPDVGHGEKRVSMAGHEWRITTTVENTPVNSVRRLTVDVSYAPGDFGEDPPTITSLTAFVGASQNGSQTSSSSP